MTKNVQPLKEMENAILKKGYSSEYSNNENVYKTERIPFDTQATAEKIEDMEKKYDHQFKVVFDAIKQLLTPPEIKKKKIGFKREHEG